MRLQLVHPRGIPGRCRRGLHLPKRQVLDELRRQPEAGVCPPSQAPVGDRDQQGTYKGDSVVHGPRDFDWDELRAGSTRRCLAPSATRTTRGHAASGSSSTRRARSSSRREPTSSSTSTARSSAPRCRPPSRLIWERTDGEVPAATPPPPSSGGYSVPGHGGRLASAEGEYTTVEYPTPPVSTPALTHLAAAWALRAEVERACALLGEAVETAAATGNSSGVTLAQGTRQRYLGQVAERAPGAPARRVAEDRPAAAGVTAQPEGPATRPSAAGRPAPAGAGRPSPPHRGR